MFVFATHHATPENGSFPGRGEEARAQAGRVVVLNFADEHPVAVPAIAEPAEVARRDLTVRGRDLVAVRVFERLTEVGGNRTEKVLKDETITIEGKRTPPKWSARLAETDAADFRRTFLVPQGIDAEKIAAELQAVVAALLRGWRSPAT